MKISMHSSSTVLTTVLVLALAACGGSQNSPVPASGLSTQSSIPGQNGNTRFNAGGQMLAVSSCGPCATNTNTPSYEYLFRLAAKGHPSRVVSNGSGALGWFTL